MRNWKVQKFFHKKESKTLWLHWWPIAELKKLRNDIDALIATKEQTGDYASVDTTLVRGSV